MCIAIVSPKGTTITSQSFRNCWDNNYNGAGFMYNDDDNKIHVVKEMDKFDRIYNKYKRLRKKFPNATFLVHFRISTHGVINKENCHPFKVNKTLGFIHNGIIHHVQKNKDYSDTNMFNRDILKNMPGISVEMLNSPAMQELIGNYIGYSKLAFMDNLGKFSIINEHKGNWGDDGIWYSNDSYKRVKTTVDYGGKTMTKNELRKLQGGSPTGSSNNVGYHKHRDDDPLEGSTYPETVGNNSLNSKVGKQVKYADDYLVSDGKRTCSCCETQTEVCELMSSWGECLECVPADEASSICAAAINDGAVLDYVDNDDILDDELFDENIEIPFPTNEDDTEDEIVECEGCLNITFKSQLTNIPQWDVKVCDCCLRDLSSQGLVEISAKKQAELDMFEH